LHAWLARNAERLVEELEHHVVAAGRLQVYVGHPAAPGRAHEIGLAQPTDRFDLLIEAGRHCLARAWGPGRAVNRMHLIATRLRRPGHVQRGLFEPPDGRSRRVGTFFTRQEAVDAYLAALAREEAERAEVPEVVGR
jgi:DNA polymerase V